MQKFEQRSFHGIIDVRKGVAETSDRCPILTLGLAACEQFPRASGRSTNGVKFLLAVVHKHSGGCLMLAIFCDGASPDDLRRSAKNLSVFVKRLPIDLRPAT